MVKFVKAMYSVKNTSDRTYWFIIKKKKADDFLLWGPFPQATTFHHFGSRSFTTATCRWHSEPPGSVRVDVTRHLPYSSSLAYGHSSSLTGHLAAPDGSFLMPPATGSSCWVANFWKEDRWCAPAPLSSSASISYGYSDMVTVGNIYVIL